MSQTFPGKMFCRHYRGFVSKNFRTCDLEQVFLLPPSLQDWLPENHLARFVAKVVNGLDLSKIYGFTDGGMGGVKQHIIR